MSSVSGDENNEIAENEPVRRTRSGRAVKKPPQPKKTPAKKPATRATRASRNIQEIEEESTQVEDESNEAPENGVQQDAEVNSAAAAAAELQEASDPLQMNENQNQNENEEMQVDQTEENMVEEENVEMEQQEEENTVEESNEAIHDQENIEENNEHMEEEENLVGENNEAAEEGNFENEDAVEQQFEENVEKENALETDNIPEFDPEEINQEENIAEDSESAPVPTDEVPEDDPSEEQLSDQNSCSLRVKDSSEMMETTTDEQFILIEDDVDQQLDTVAESETSNQGDESDKKYAQQDSEIILDNDQFRNEDVEFISETNENVIESSSQKEDAQEVIEISDHEGDTPGKKSVPDTEAVSEDELPSEGATKEPETEAVSDEELPAAQPADLGETESVSDDELPVESEKKRKGKPAKKTSGKKAKSDSSKRKRTAEGEYDPSSPTSENNDETPSKKLAVSSDSSDKPDTKPASPKKKTLPELEKYWKAVNDDPTDFTGWTYLLQYVDQESDAEAAREAYSKFLQRYPYCYGYWRKYADYEKKKGDPTRVQAVFDQGLKAISLSVDLWLHYINHCKVVYEKDEEKMREQYERAIEACGLEFRSDRLWESYIKWEMENKRYNKVMGVYDRLLCTPTFDYMTHFESFQEFVSTHSPQRILSVDDFLALRSEVKSLLKSDDTGGPDDAPPGEDSPTSEKAPSDEETRAIREKIISTRRKMHKSNVNAVAARWTFEEGIKRPYFHVKPLERCQLKNWKEYLDNEIDQKDPTRIIILFERCLIACALYDEFWMRFVRYLESLKGDNTEKIRDVYTRACTVHHPKKPNLHLLWATFEESVGNFDKAASILENIDNVIPNMLQIAYRRINLERRRNDLDKTCVLYEHYISNSKNRTIANNIVVKYARFLCKIKNDTDKAIKVLLKATEKDKDNPRLYLQLIDLGLQRNPINVQEVVSYIDLFIDREHADAEQRVLFAQRKVEFLEDFSTDIKQVLKAHEQFQKCIKQAKDRKKVKSDESKTETPPKKSKIDTSSVPPPQPGSQSYQYSGTAPYQSQQQFQSSQYGAQSGYQQGYQQYPPPTDPNYANYQNWQYGQSGPQAYTPYNQWSSYNYY